MSHAALDEIQTLKTAINKMFGQAEDGESEIDVVNAQSLAGTSTASAFLLAGTAIQKLELSGGVGGSIVDALLDGTAKIEKVLGNGRRAVSEGMTKVTKSVGKNMKFKALQAQGAQVSGQQLLAVGNLALSLGNTTIALGNLNLIDKIQTNNTVNFIWQQQSFSSLTSLFAKQEGNLAAANQRITEGNEKLVEQTDINQLQAQQIQSANTTIANLEADRNNLAGQVSSNGSAFNAYKLEVEAYQDEVEGVITGLQQQVSTMEQSQATAESIIEAMTGQISDLKLQVTELETRVEALENQISDLQLTLTAYYVALIEMERDFEEDVGLLEIRVKYLEAKQIVSNSKLRSAGGGAGTITAARTGAQTQNGILDLAGTLAGSREGIPTITNDDIYNNTNTFGAALGGILANIDTGREVTPENIADIREGIKIDMQDLILPGLGLMVTPQLARITQQTSAPAIQSATTTAVCNASAPGGCMNNNMLQPIQDNLGNLVNAGGTAFSAANNVLLTQMKPVLNAVDSTTRAIKATTATTLGVVTHAQHGLEAMQNFASTAWKATHADKVLNAITTVMVVHTAAMISSNLAVTVGEMASVALNAIGIQDSDNNPIDVNGVIKAKLDSMIVNLVGEEQSRLITERIAKYNRIYQAGANILDTTKNLFDSAHSIAEIGIEHTGKIGNALRDASVVGENAYEEMVEKVNPQSAALRKIQKFRENAESIEKTQKV